MYGGFVFHHTKFVMLCIPMRIIEVLCSSAVAEGVRIPNIASRISSDLNPRIAL
jgi:hypothetical protein